MSLGSVFSAWPAFLITVTKELQKGQYYILAQNKARLIVGIWAFLFCIGMSTSSARAQVVSDPLITNNDTSLQLSLDSLMTSLESMRADREALRSEVRRLNSRIQSLESNVDRRVEELVSGQGTVLEGLDTLRILMPSDEPIKATNTNVLYLNQRQDSLVAHVERLEERILSLPDKHYWGVRNGFQQFDHLLLFTFLGALTSLGVVLLVKGGPKRMEFGDDFQLMQEEEADRLSVSITLLVGSVLVILFILFIL